MLKFKMMRKFLAIIMMWAGLIACSDDKDVLVSIPNDVTMNELNWDVLRIGPWRAVYFESCSYKWGEI